MNRPPPPARRKPSPGTPQYRSIDIKALVDSADGGKRPRKVDYQFSNGRQFTSLDK